MYDSYPDDYDNYDQISLYRDIDFEAVDYNRVADIVHERGYWWLFKSVCQVFIFNIDRSCFMIRLRLYWNKYTLRSRPSQSEHNPF